MKLYSHAADAFSQFLAQKIKLIGAIDSLFGIFFTGRKNHYSAIYRSNRNSQRSNDNND